MGTRVPTARVPCTCPACPACTHFSRVSITRARRVELARSTMEHAWPSSTADVASAFTQPLFRRLFCSLIHWQVTTRPICLTSSVLPSSRVTLRTRVTTFSVSCPLSGHTLWCVLCCIFRLLFLRGQGGGRGRSHPGSGRSERGFSAWGLARRQGTDVRIHSLLTTVLVLRPFTNQETFENRVQRQLTALHHGRTS